MDVENTFTEGVIDLNVEIKVEEVSENDVESKIELYADHVIKEEMVIGPEVLQPVVYTSYRPEDAPVPKKPKLETTDEETDQIKPPKVKKEDNSEGIISNVDFKKNLSTKIETKYTTSINTKQTNQKCNQTPGVSENVFICHNKKFSCSHCHYKCKRKSALSTHLRIHTGEKPYSCSHCGYKCNETGSLSKHLRIHTGEKPYSCSHCDYKCKQKSDLLTHLRTHSAEKPYSCSHCDYKCKIKGALLRHLRIHTGEKPYSCSHCDYKFNRKDHLSKHVFTLENNHIHALTVITNAGKWVLYQHTYRTHTDVKPYSCSHCEYKCAYKSSLAKHLVRIHADQILM